MNEHTTDLTDERLSEIERMVGRGQYDDWMSYAEVQNLVGMARRTEQAERERDVLRALLADLLRSDLSADEARLCMVRIGGALGTREQSPELHERCDRMAAAQDAARIALAQPSDAGGAE